ncbi:hypothetical protein [Lysobacter hankyongensis]|uniref:DUF541 domain-containing protein n=1 Tax=Lysobacter hankyongensis TaxID=1176535 RepID=A0ABP9AQ41_9GAMM
MKSDIRAWCALVCIASALSAARAADTPAPLLRPYVEESRISAPKHAGSLLLTAAEHDVARRMSGVVLRYRDGNAPETTITFVIHPAGDEPEQKSLKAEFRALQTRLAEGAASAGHADYEVVDVSGVSVKLPPKRGNSTTIDLATGQPIPNPTPSSQNDVLYPQKPLRGQRMTTTYLDRGAGNDAPSRRSKYIYLFNRHMYFIRATVTNTGVLPNQELEKRSDEIIENIVSQIGIENIGRCGAMSMYVNDAATASIGQILHAMEEMGWRSCVESTTAATLTSSNDSSEVVTIRYEPADWSVQ